MNYRINIAMITAFLSLTITAQQPSRFPIKPGSVWRINYEYYCDFDPWENKNGDERYKYFIDGDTTINSKLYFKLYKTGILFLDSPLQITHKYIGAIRDSADKFFYVDENELSEVLLYNFSATVGETMQPDGLPVYKIDTLENERKIYLMDIMTVHCGSANTIIEGIGWLGGLLEGNSCSGHPGVRGSYVVCYTEDGNIIYQNDRSCNGTSIACDLNISSIGDNNLKNKIGIVVLPEKAIKFILPEGVDENFEVEIYSVTGMKFFDDKVNPNETIDINNFESGTYIASLKNRNGFFVAKFVVD